MYITLPRILQYMSHHPVFSDVYHTAQNSPMYVTPTSFFWCMSHSPEFFDVCHTTQFSLMYEKWNNIPHYTQTEINVTQPRILCGTAHRWQWDHPQVAVELPTGGSEAAHRWQWGHPWLLVSRVTENTVNLESHLPRGRNTTISIIDSDSKIWWWSDEVYSWPPPHPLSHSKR